MSRYRLELTLDEATLSALDAARGHERRASFVKRVLGEALEGSASPSPQVADTTGRKAGPPASRRASLPSVRGSASPGLERFKAK